MSDTWLAVFPLAVANVFNCSLSFIFISLPGIPPVGFVSAKIGIKFVLPKIKPLKYIFVYGLPLKTK